MYLVYSSAIESTGSAIKMQQGLQRLIFRIMEPEAVARRLSAALNCVIGLRGLTTVSWGASADVASQGLAVRTARDERGTLQMQGVVALLALNCLESDKQHPHEWGSPEHLHALIECARLGFADGLQHVADPQVGCLKGAAVCACGCHHQAAGECSTAVAIRKCTGHAAALSACTRPPSMCC